MLTVAPGARLEIVARSAPELIERVCRVIRHRGGRIDRLVADATPGGTTTVEVTVSGTGDPGLLVRQLERLPDVRTAGLVDTTMSHRRATA